MHMGVLMCNLGMFKPCKIYMYVMVRMFVWMILSLYEYVNVGLSNRECVYVGVFVITINIWMR